MEVALRLWNAWLVIGFSIICSLGSWIPNFIDQSMSVQYDNGISAPRNRHPLTHSPWSLLYFLPLIYLAGKVRFEPLQIIFNLVIISWLSHLILDTLNPGGLPLGRQSVFTNHPVKHYKFPKNYPSKTRTLRFARIPFNDPKANRYLGYVGLFIFSLNLATNVLTFFWG